MICPAEHGRATEPPSSPRRLEDQPHVASAAAKTSSSRSVRSSISSSSIDTSTGAAASWAEVRSSGRSLVPRAAPSSRPRSCSHSSRYDELSARAVGLRPRPSQALPNSPGRELYQRSTKASSAVSGPGLGRSGGRSPNGGDCPIRCVTGREGHGQLAASMRSP